MLGNIPGTDIYRDLHHYKESVKIPGFLILSIEAPINFANSTYLNERLVLTLQTLSVDHVLQALLIIYSVISFSIIGILLQRILRWIEEYEAEEDLQKQSSLLFMILEMSGTSDSTMSY